MRRALSALAIFLIAGPASGEPLRWQGAYVGVNTGYGHGESEATAYPAGGLASPFVPSGTSIGANASGVLFGVQAGYDWQWSSFVAGVVADFDAADIKGSGQYSVYITAQPKVFALGTLRTRFGYAFDRALIYATGGLAYGRTNLDTSFTNVFFSDNSSFNCLPNGAPTSFACGNASTSQWRAGWTIGAGIEYAISDRWSLKAECLHYDLGSQSQTMKDPTILALANPIFGVTANFRGDIARVGLDYKLTP